MARKEWLVHLLTAVLALSPTVSAATPAAPAEPEWPALELAPCTVELVDGRQVDGKLAVQFNLSDHLVVYSPRLATVRSFLKKHIHALAVDGERRQLNPKRTLTAADRKLLGSVKWPDEPPVKGRKPAYTTETWDKPKRLLVWASPGKSGRFEDAKNWLVNGERMAEWPRPTGMHYGFVFFKKDGVDFLFPASSEDYTVRPRRTNARARHITTEAGANAQIRLNNCTGNLWVSADGSFNGGGGAQLGGRRHTFLLNGRPYVGEPPTTPQRFAELMASAKGFARKWVVRKEDPAASIHLIGTIRSGDETHWFRGVTVLTESSVVSIGPRCVQTIGTKATFIMKPGSVLGKNRNQLYKNDMRVKGELLAGTPAQPLTRDCYLGISIKDSRGRSVAEAPRRYGARGLTVAPGAIVEVHTADPAEARLIVTWHGTEPGGDDGSRPGAYEKIPEAERTINVNLLGDQVLNDVVFDCVGQGDLRLLTPAIRRKWRRVGFGARNTAEGDALFAKFEPDDETAKQVARWRDEARKHNRDEGFGAVAAGQGARNPRILPSGGTFAAGTTVAVCLRALGDPEIRYTLDGGDSQEGKVYSGPFELDETTTLKAGCFHHPGPHFRKQWGRVVDTFTFFGGARNPDAPGETTGGLKLRIYPRESLEELHAQRGKPVHVQEVDRFVLKVPDGRRKEPGGYVYTGYVQVHEPGVYRFYTETEGASRLYIGDRLVVDNHRRYRYDWKPSGKAPLESWGSLRLKPGKHAIRVEYARGRGFAWWQPQEDEPFQVCYEGPGIAKQPIPTRVLSH